MPVGSYVVSDVAIVLEDAVGAAEVGGLILLPSLIVQVADV